jgi:PEGA domain
MTLRFHAMTLSLVLAMASMLPGNLLHGDNKVLGELQFEGATNVERGSGVWVDGQYLGYLKELKGSKTVLLLPGEHEIVIRQAGYKDFSQRVTLQPGDKRLIQVTLQKDTRLQMPAVTAEIKLSVDPDRAAVFVDGMFAGHAGELGGVGEGLLVAPGKRRITISLPGYRNFETEVELAPNQKFEIKTKLIKAVVSQE